MIDAASNLRSSAAATPSVVLDLVRLKDRWCGLGAFAHHLGRAVEELRDSRVRFQYLVPPIRDAKFPTADSTRLIPARFWRKSAAPQLLRTWGRRDACDLWHTTDHLSDYSPPDRNIPVVLTIHDLNFSPDRSQKSIARSLRILQARVDRAAVLTTVSEFAAGQIRSHLELGGKALHVIPHGVCLPTPVDSVQPKVQLDPPFFFSIGVFRPTKNLHRLVEMMRYLPEQRLVLAGNHDTPYGRDVLREIRAAGLADRILTPGIVTESERHWLYTHCQSFLFPSTAEGFGLPVIEAMHFGCPVFMAAETSLPEIGGDCGHYWSSLDPQTMAEELRRGLLEVTADHRARNRARAAAFSWERAATQYCDLYLDIIESSRALSYAA